MTWITENWELKLLALVLSLGLFAAVAFQQNPIQSRTLNAAVSYEGRPNEIALVNAPSRQPVTLSGLAADMSQVSASSVIVKVDVSRVKPGQQVLVTGRVQVSAAGVTAGQDRISFNVTVEEEKTRAIPIEARLTFAPGWEAVKTTVDPAVVNVAGPASFVADLKAYVSYTQVSASLEAPSLAIVLEKQAHEVTLPTNTNPAATIDATTAKLTVLANKPKQSRKVPVVETPTGNPAQGYRITDLKLDPLFITISGTVDDLSKVGDSITLPALAVDGLTTTISRTVRPQLPAGVSTDTATVTVTIVVQQNPVVKPSPPPPAASPGP